MKSLARENAQMSTKQAYAFAYLFVLVIMLWLGPMAWNYVAPLFKLPVLSWWQWFVTGVALRCLRGPNTQAMNQVE